MLSIAQLKLTSQMVYCLPGFFSERLCLIYFPISFLGGLPTSICHFFNPSIRPSICLSVHRVQYFRNCTSRDHYFHSTMTKNSVRQTPYPRNHTSYDCHLWYTCVKWWDLQEFFFIFSKILIFWVVRGVKMQKMVQNDIKISLLQVSQEPYIMWLSFMVHMCKMISPGFFFVFSKFWFFGWEGKKWSRMTKHSVCRGYLRNHTSYDCHLWYTCVKWYLQVFFCHFFKILIFWVVRGVKGKKTVQNDKKFCSLHSMSQEPYIMWLSFVVHTCKMIISSGLFFIFSKFWFSVHRGGKG